MGFGAKDLASVGRARTVSVSVAAAALVPPLAVVRPPAAIVFTRVPAAADTTFTVTVHEPLAGMAPPESATDGPPSAAVTVPPAHVVVPVAGVAFTSPAG